MADWTGAGLPTSEVYTRMADRDLNGVSPTYQGLCRGVAGSAQVCALLDELPPPKRQPNLLLAAVRFIDGPVEDVSSFLAFVTSRWPDVRAVINTHRTQTNEPGRCATLLPLLASLPQPLALLEIGASAGLCLYPDRYSYRYHTAAGDHLLGDGPVSLSCTVTGPIALPHALPNIAWRAGLDLNPLHADRAEDRRWLACLIWPEQTDRAQRLDAALDLIAAEPPRIDVGDLMADLPALIADAPPDATLVVFHSAVLAYLDRAQRERFTVLMNALRTERGVEWLSNEAPGVIEGTELETTGFVLAHNQRPIARAGPHGHTLDWLNSAL